MRQTLAWAIIVFLCLSACKGSKGGESFFADDETVEEDSVEVFVGDTLHLYEDVDPPATVDELFNDFFFEFAGDMRFQKQRIHFPLPLSDDGEASLMSREEWVSEDRFAGQEFFSVIYEREQDYEMQKDTSVSRVAIDWVHLSDETIDTYRFQRYEGLWVLTGIERKPVVQHGDAGFLQFFSHFMADTLYQRDALAEPVRLVLTPQSDEDDTQVEDIDLEGWCNLRADLPFSTSQLISIDYGQQCDDGDSRTLAIEGLSNGFSMKLRFTREDEQWRLYEIEY